MILNSTSDAGTLTWAQRELKYIEDFAALDALYRETLKTASQLVEPGSINDPRRVQARARYNQLYWADLPYAGESQQVIRAMIAFRDQLIVAENTVNSPKAEQHWEALKMALIRLSTALRESTPDNSLNQQRD